MSEEEAKINTEKRIEPAGCSENGAGLAVDIVSASAGFASTPEYQWLEQNAHKYGFVLRYPQDKTEITGIIYQPWHWRYVGIDAATEMKENNLCLEEYLGAV
jgi:D-alanyl-D-alanine carboxypeptidase